MVLSEGKQILYIEYIRDQFNLLSDGAWLSI